MGEDVVVLVLLVVAVDVLSICGALETQGHLHHTDVARQIEARHLDVKLTRTFLRAGLVEGQSTGIGLAQDHQHGQFLVHPPFLLPQNAKIIVVVAVQGLSPAADKLDPEDRSVVRHHHPERHMGDIGGDLFLVVIDHDPTPTLKILAHVRPEDAGGTPHHHHHHQAFRRRLHQDVDQGGEGLRPVNDRGPFQGIVMAGEMKEAEDLGDHAQLTHRTMKEFQGLMLSRTVPHETTVVLAAVGTATVTDGIVVGLEVEVAAKVEVAGEASNEGGLWRDGHQPPEGGAILHLLPPLMTSGKRLLTHLLTRNHLIRHQDEVIPIKIWPRMIKRWVTIDDVLQAPSLPKCSLPYFFI